MNDLFATTSAPPPPPASVPLAERLRPQSLAEVIGQDHLLQAGGLLHQVLATGTLPSLILWGPPGSGKTTLARLLAKATGARLVPLSALAATAADLKKIFSEAQHHHQRGTRTILFIDEIHRLNRAQLDLFLPWVEAGSIILLGATTENPSFEINAALLSRCLVVVLKPLQPDHLELLLQRAEQFVGQPLPLTPAARTTLLEFADGDGRYLLALAEVVAAHQGAVLDSSALATLVQRRALRFDRDREEHYNLISALHKSLRGSDADAALYWLARLLVAGEEPRFIARRLVRFASEDIGLADPQALQQALAAAEVYERLGSPEGELALVQATVYLATAPKSNALYRAYKVARAAAEQHGSLMPPKTILNAPTALMRQVGYGAGYQYDHDTPDAFSGQNYFPDGMARLTLYHPSLRGYEAVVTERLAAWAKKRGAA